MTVALVNIHNPSAAMCVFFDGARTVSIKPGETALNVALPDPIRAALQRTWPELALSAVDLAPYRAVDGKLPLRINGMHGIGDCLHQRSVVRELMKKNDVWLATCHHHVYHDLIEDGLKLIFQPTRLRAQAKTIERERGLFPAIPVAFPAGGHEIKLWYRKDQIDKFGSILQAMHGVCDVLVERPDFSLPVPRAWHAKLDAKLKLDTGGKPLMVLRPIVLRQEWNSRNRNPDPEAYRTLYQAAREGFFTISIADIQEPVEVIEGPELDADLKLHRGELDFCELAALWQRANVVFCNAGFAAVLAQAVGTPSIIIYGGRESYRTTDRAGEHLAPTCGVDPIRVCDCHTERCDPARYGCTDKKIDVPVALERIKEFIAPLTAPRTIPQQTAPCRTRPELGEPNRAVAKHTEADILIFGTTYVDCKERQQLTEQWLTLTSRLNPDCDLLLVDSASPVPLVRDGFEMPSRVDVFTFPDNVGHLSRGGRDGWGRAFCKGLDLAVQQNYGHVLHIEGDSLLRVPAQRLVDELSASGKGVGTIIVQGMHREMSNWAETGLMVFSTDYLKRTKFTLNYDWPTREVRPTPEMVVNHIIGNQLHRLKLKGMRGDRNEITHDNIIALNLDWVTHCHNDIWAYDRFMEAYCPQPEREREQPKQPVATSLKLNLGCGTNRLAGWENHDAEVDITKRLPWSDGAADFILIEHCVEHVTCHEAIRFFEEAHRVLKPGGVLRVVVPSIEQIRKRGTKDYFRFVKKWGGTADLHGALKAIIFAHGHQMIWTASVMREALLYAGFDEVDEREVGESPFEQLRGVEGHGAVIGDAFNRIESMVFEGRKAPVRVAVVVGGAITVEEEIAKTRQLLERAGARAEWFVVNDMIERFPEPCIAISLHPEKLPGWLERRAANGHPSPLAVWAHRQDHGVTDAIEDWHGSSGLHGVTVARKHGFERIVLCGVPMDQDIGNINGAPNWIGENGKGAMQFRPGWIMHHDEIAPYTRSWGGWTRERLGAPDEAFLS